MSCCGDSPDYDAVAASNAQAASYAKEAADNELAFRRQVYNEQRPAIDRLVATSADAADAQLEAMREANDWAGAQHGFWRDTYMPMERRSAQEAMDAGGVADQERAAGRAAADARMQNAISQSMAERAMTSMGINPNSGRFMSGQRATTLANAAGAAGAVTNAREGARDRGVALRAGAVQTGRGMQNVAGQSLGLGVNAGSAAVGSANTGAQGGLGWAQFGAGNAGNAIGAANLQQQGGLGLANIQAHEAAQSGSTLGGLIGLGARIGYGVWKG